MLTALALIAAVHWTSIVLLFVTIASTLLLAHLVRIWFFGTRDKRSNRPGPTARPTAQAAKRQPAAGRKKARRK